MADDEFDIDEEIDRMISDGEQRRSVRYVPSRQNYSSSVLETSIKDRDAAIKLGVRSQRSPPTISIAQNKANNSISGRKSITQSPTALYTDKSSESPPQIAAKRRSVAFVAPSDGTRNSLQPEFDIKNIKKLSFDDSQKSLMEQMNTHQEVKGRQTVSTFSRNVVEPDETSRPRSQQFGRQTVSAYLRNNPRDKLIQQEYSENDTFKLEEIKSNSASSEEDAYSNQNKSANKDNVEVDHRSKRDDSTPKRGRAYLFDDSFKEELKDHKQTYWKKLETLMKNDRFKKILKNLGKPKEEDLKLIDLESADPVNLRDCPNLTSETQSPTRTLSPTQTLSRAADIIDDRNTKQSRASPQEKNNEYEISQDPGDPADLLPRKGRLATNNMIIKRPRSSYNMATSIDLSENSQKEPKSPGKLTRLHHQLQNQSNGFAVKSNIIECQPPSSLNIVPTNTIEPHHSLNNLPSNFKNVLENRKPNRTQYVTKSSSLDPEPYPITNHANIARLASFGGMRASFGVKSRSKTRRHFKGLALPLDRLKLLEDEEEKIASFIPSEECLECLFITGNPRRDHYDLDFHDSETMELSSNFYLCLDDIISNTMLGQPRALELDSRGVLYIGTSKGAIYIHEPQFGSLEKLGTSLDHQDGAISTLKLFKNHIWLLAGHETGKVVLWDVHKQTVIKRIAHRTSPILALDTFRTEPIGFLVADSEGRVSKITLTKKLFGDFQVDETLLLNKSAGPVLDIKTIMIKEQYDKTKEIVRGGFLAAIVSSSRVIVVVFNPDPKIIHAFSFVQDFEGNFAYVCWGCIQYKNQERLCMLISSGHVIELICFNIEEEITWKTTHHIILESFVANVEFIRCNYFSVIDRDNKIHLLHIEDFSEGPLDNLAFLHDQKPAPSKKTYYIDQLIGELYSPYLVAGFDGLGAAHYHRSIFYSPIASRFYLICRKGITMVRLFSSYEFLDEILRHKKYKMFLTMTIELLNGNLREVHPGTDVSTLALTDSTLYTYIREKLLLCIYNRLFKGKEDKDIQNQNPKLVMRVAQSLIDFCLEIHFDGYLFTVIKKSFELIGLNNFFLEALEPFILLNKVNYIPEMQLSEVVIYLEKTRKTMTLHRLFLNLKLELYDLTRLVSMCAQNNLLFPMIYSGTHGNDDYIAPLVYAILQFEKTLAENNNQDDIEASGNDVIWYMRMCLQDRQIYSRLPIEEGVWKSVVMDVLKIVFVKDRISKLIQVCAYQFIPICLLMFQGEIESIVSENSSSLIGSSEQNKGSQSNQNALEKIYNSIISSLEDEGENSTEDHQQQLKNCWNFFIAGLAEIKNFFQLPEKLALQSVQGLLNDPDLLCKENLLFYFKALRPIQNRGVRIATNIEKLVEEELDEDFFVTRRDQLALALIKYCKGLIVADVRTLESIQQAAELSPFPSVRSYVSYLKGDLKKSIEIFTFKSVPHQIKMNIFPWIEFLLSRLENVDRNKLSEIQKMILDRIGDIVSIDTKMTKHIIEKYFADYKIKVVKSLESNPELQLKYLQEELEGETSIEHDIAREYVNEVELYIRLLCQSRQKEQRKKILEKLQKYEGYYKLEDAVVICERNDVKDALAYLKERSGKLGEAIRHKVEWFEEKLEEYWNNQKELTPERILKLLNIITEIEQTLKSSLDEHEIEANWKVFILSLAKCVWQFEKKSQSALHSENYHTFINNILNDVLLQSFTKISYVELMNAAESSKGMLNMKNLRTPLQKYIANTSFHRFIYRDATLSLMGYFCELTEQSLADSKVAIGARNNIKPTENGTRRVIDQRKNAARLTEEEKCYELLVSFVAEDQFEQAMESDIIQRRQNITYRKESNSGYARSFKNHEEKTVDSEKRRKMQMLSLHDRFSVDNVIDIDRMSSKLTR